MKIAIFLYGLSGGGATRRTLALAEAWVERGHHVDLLLLDAEGPLSEQVSAGLRLVKLKPVLPRAWARSRRRRLVAAIPGLVRYLRTKKPDIFLSAANHAHLSALLAARLGRVKTPVVIRVSNHLTVSHQLTGERGRLEFARKCYGWADAAIGVSEGISQDLKKHIGPLQNKIYTISNPAFSSRIQTLAARPLPPGWDWLFSGNGPVILGAGRLTRQKDFPTLLRAFARFKHERSARLVILGEGKLRSDLERLSDELGLAGDVFLPGFMSNPYAWMARADLFVLSSAWEGSPGVLVEAMACGCPVVSTCCPSGPEEILENGRYGRLVAVGDAAGLARAMADTLSHPQDRNRLIERAGQFSVPQAAEAYLSVFENLLPGR